ncbi:MAG: IPTL-CTERM sorting domain-containing protein [Luminiphilus sp.]|nr:IPTL-CTERM sorting domain-containing protein [Luminiphilus sp.]
MNIKMVCGAVVALAAAFSSVGHAQTTLMSDDFESLDKTAALVGNDWLWQKQYFTDAGCVTYNNQYPGNPEAAKNQNYFTVIGAGGGGTSYGEYSNQGIADGDNSISGDLSLNVYADTYGLSNDACTRSRTFKTVTTTSLASDDVTLASGEYTVAAKAKISFYDADQTLKSGAKVGVFLTVIDLDDTTETNNYGIITNTYREVAISKAGVVTVAEKFDVALGTSTNLSVTAGFYSQNDLGAGDGGIWDYFSLSFATQSEQEAEAEAVENAACADTSVLRFEDAFGGAEVKCLTDTYQVPADAESFAGFGDTKRNVDMYPFYKPESITFDCATVSGSAEVSFQFENAPYPANTSIYRTDSVTCNSGTSSVGSGTGKQSSLAGKTSKTIAIPAGDTTTWGNLLLYVKGEAPVTITDIKVVGGYSGTAATAAAAADAAAAKAAAPVPALPIWGLLALSGLIGFMGLRRRRK